MSGAPPLTEDIKNVIFDSVDDIPSIYVDQRLLLTKNSIQNGSGVNYRIGNSVYCDETYTDDKISEDQTLQEFELNVERLGRRKTKMDLDYEAYCSTPTDSESEYEEDSDPLKMTIQRVPHGIIINSNVYLTDHQWNTLIFIDVKMVQCAVCDVFTDLASCPAHIDGEGHRNALEQCKPLEKFDLSVTRNIGNKYHCAVCNELFDSCDNFDHFGCKMHEGNLLFAINKASDIIYDLNTNNDTNNDTKKMDTYHFNENNIIDNHSNDNASNYSDFEYHTNNDRFINFQNHYYDNEREEFEYYEPEAPPVYDGESYATMAKKPKVILQKFVDIDLGNKKVKVKHDSWHMVISPVPNRFYCMVCKKFDHIRKKIEHCAEAQHLVNLEKCKVVETYEEYFIRQVDHRLYHCGHCNNLQLIHEMQDHIEVIHPRKTKILDGIIAKSPSPIYKTNKDDEKATKNIINDMPSTPTKKHGDKIIKNNNNDTLTPSKNKNHDSPKQMNYRATPSNDKVQKQINDINRNNDKNVFNISSDNDKNKSNDIKFPGILDTIVIYPFGYKLNVSILSYNVVCKRQNDFYCGLCDVICPEDVISRHIYEIRHIELLQRTPFILPFNCNLIRAIREALHCAICNMPVGADKIYTHIREPKHVDTLTQALGISRAAVKTDKVPANVHADVKTSNSDINLPFNDNNKIAVAMGGVNDFNLNKKIINDNNKTINDKKEEINDKKVVVNDNKRVDNGCQRVDDDFKELDKDISEAIDDNEMEIDDEEYNSVDCNEDEQDFNDDFDATFDSTASGEVTFDVEEYVYLKLRNTYIKIANTSYNTLVCVGDGSRYCFVCDLQVDYVEVQRHVDSRPHLENMEKYRFLDKYEDHLLRQIFLTYHCSICNVIITRKELKTHLEWPTHALQNDNTIKNIKKTRKTEIKGGIKQINVSTQKENIYLNGKEPKIDVLLNVEPCSKAVESVQKIQQNTPRIDSGAQTFTKKNKIIIFNDNVLKVSWDSWHGVSKIKNGYKCNLCQRDLKTDEIDVHCNSDWHKYALEKPFEKQHAPALIRKINELTLNCLICNTEVSNKDHIIYEHINGKRHVKNYEMILKDSSQANTYTDCNDDVLML